MGLHSMSKLRPAKKVNNFFQATLDRVEEETQSQIRTEDEIWRRVVGEDLVLTPQQIIFQSTWTAYKYLYQFDRQNFTCYKHLFDRVLMSGKRFEKELHDLYAGVMLQYEVLTACSPCNLFSLFFKGSKSKEQCLTDQFIRSFLDLGSIHSNDDAQKYCDSVNKLITGELALVPVANAV